MASQETLAACERLLDQAGQGAEGALLVGPDFVAAMPVEAWSSEDWSGESLCLVETPATTPASRSRGTAHLWGDFSHSLKGLLADGPTPGTRI